MGDAAAAEKEFTKEERALLKFQKKQQHGQVCLVLVYYMYFFFLSIPIILEERIEFVRAYY